MPRREDGAITAGTSMLNIGAGELTVILVLALLILGPKRLPELARGIGKFLREFRRQTDEVRTTIETEFYRMDRELQEDEPRKPTPLPSAQPASAQPVAAPAPASEIGSASAAPSPVGDIGSTPRDVPPIAANAPATDATAESPGKWEE